MMDYLLEFVKDVLLFFLGLFVVRLYDWWKKVTRRNEIIDVLIAELTVIRDAIPTSGQNVARDNFPFITDAYDGFRSEILSMKWKDDTISLLHRTYSDIRKLNEPQGITDFGYERIIGTTDYIYIQGLAEVRQKVESLIEKLRENRIN